MIIWPKIILVLLGLTGLSLSSYIRHSKLYAEKLICPLGTDCHTVVKSSYARFLGFPVEILGIVYYSLVVIGYFVSFFSAPTPAFIFFLALASAAAFLFSVYLTAVQAFALRQWCTLCLFSAGLSTAIFLITVFFSEYNFVSLLSRHYSLIVLFHTLAASVGVGAVTVADILFFRFLRDFKISLEEADILRTLSQTIWLVLGILVLSGLGLYLPEAGSLSQSAGFLSKIIIIGVIIVNGFLLNMLVSPRLIQISFGEVHPHQTGELKKLRHLAFASGAISLVSWYSVFILGTLRYLPYSFGEIFGVYLVILAGAILLSQYFETGVARGKMSE